MRLGCPQAYGLQCHTLRVRVGASGVRVRVRVRVGVRVRVRIRVGGAASTNAMTLARRDGGSAPPAVRVRKALELGLGVSG